MSTHQAVCESHADATPGERLGRLRGRVLKALARRPMTAGEIGNYVLAAYSRPDRDHVLALLEAEKRVRSVQIFYYRGGKHSSRLYSLTGGGR